MDENKELPPLFDNDESKNDLDFDDDDGDIFASAIQVCHLFYKTTIIFL